MIEIVLAFDWCSVCTRPVLMTDDVPFPIFKVDALRTVLLVPQILQIPLYLVIRQADLKQKFAK